MPKEKLQARTQSRRAASKEALKQMHILLGDEKKYEISSDDDDVIEVEVQPPKKKYKLSHRKSSDGNDREVIVLKPVEEDLFDLEVVIEDLAACQKSERDHRLKEYHEVNAKIEQLLSAPNTEVIYNGVYTTAVEVNEQVQSILAGSASVSTQFPLPAQTTATTVQQPMPGQSIVLQQQPAATTTIPQSYQLVMDPRLGVIVGTVSAANPSPNTPPLQLYQPKVTMTAPATSSVAGNDQQQMKTRRGTILRQVPSNSQLSPLNKTTLVQSKGLKPTKTLQVKQNLIAKNVQPKPSPGSSTKIVPTSKAIMPTKGRPTSYKPSENNVEGGLNMGTPPAKIDLTSDETRADCREVSFNKLQGRTYPSLVVVARPHLRVKDLASDRAKLDVKVKSVLMYPPTKFTEWLIQQGLVRSEQKCSLHPNNALKLGMYSDASKFPYSGGYVWISECCPQRFMSVFSSSIFEGSQHPPMAILKLLYHWCCQTIVQNVTQWVKVDNLYVKGMYTWLRAVCTVALHTHVKQLGGPGVKVQVGVISLGTTSQDGNKREVKVEVLGILETNTRHLRLRAVEPLSDGERNYKKRFSKILEPVVNWVHPASVIVTDLTVDKATLHQLGFLNVTQSTSTEYANSNRTIMEYLRRIVPRMFQNTLSLLSRPIIQQFLDELVWREWYGTTVLQCFDNMVTHLSEQTRYDSGQPLVSRLNKVSANPFKNWAIPTGANTPVTAKSDNAATPKRYGRQRKPATPLPPSPAIQDIVRPVRSTSPDIPEQMVPLENYYYGTMMPSQHNHVKVTLHIKCPFCKMTFNSNISLMNHLFKHAHNVSSDVQLCKYCLMIAPSSSDLLKHICTSHPDETKFDNGFVCLICEMSFRNPFILGKHMSKEHCPSELPYMCGTCSFRCSSHKQAVDHFYQQHDQGTSIQCPFCLKSLTVYSGGRNVTQNMNYFVMHLRKHQKKHLAKRCGRCTLWFIQKDFLKEHQTVMHISQRGKPGLIPCFAPRNGVMVPKSKMDKCPSDAKVINFSTLYYNVGKNLKCKECDKPLSTPKHFVSFETCQNSNCQYSTCCSTAMLEHTNKCKSSHEDVAIEKLPFEMFCICGYRDIDGNQMAKHLALCERKSAYPSKQAAKSATFNQCMLDVLGLVRKSEESKRPEGSSVQPIILKHRGRPKKSQTGAKSQPKGITEVKDVDSESSVSVYTEGNLQSDGNESEKVVEIEAAKKENENENSVHNSDRNQDSEVKDEVDIKATEESNVDENSIEEKNDLLEIRRNIDGSGETIDEVVGKSVEEGIANGDEKVKDEIGKGANDIEQSMDKIDDKVDDDVSNGEKAEKEEISIKNLDFSGETYRCGDNSLIEENNIVSETIEEESQNHEEEKDQIAEEKRSLVEKCHIDEKKSHIDEIHEKLPNVDSIQVDENIEMKDLNSTGLNEDTSTFLPEMIEESEKMDVDDCLSAVNNKVAVENNTEINSENIICPMDTE